MRCPAPGTEESAAGRLKRGHSPQRHRGTEGKGFGITGLEVVIPAKAGIHLSTSALSARWLPAGAAFFLVRCVLYASVVKFFLTIADRVQASGWNGDQRGRRTCYHPPPGRPTKEDDVAL